MWTTASPYYRVGITLPWDPTQTPIGPTAPPPQQQGGGMVPPLHNFPGSGGNQGAGASALYVAALGAGGALAGWLGFHTVRAAVALGALGLGAGIALETWKGSGA